jgi:hypothetical protein
VRKNNRTLISGYFEGWNKTRSYICQNIVWMLYFISLKLIFYNSKGILKCKRIHHESWRSFQLPVIEWYQIKNIRKMRKVFCSVAKFPLMLKTCGMKRRKCDARLGENFDVF